MKGCYEHTKCPYCGHIPSIGESIHVRKTGHLTCNQCKTVSRMDEWPQSPPEKAVKHNKGKTPWGLLLRDMEKELEEVVRVREYGAAKYSRDNWKLEKPDDDVFTDAAIRHILSYLGGQSTDEESSLPHLAHAICTLLMAMHHDRNGK